jgi:LysR family transcriptional regulator, glycine cleavage system transcriptional activator
MIEPSSAPTPRLPPLNALRAFEAAARHASATRAARELCVTQTAVSHQIRLLEDHLALKLFRRLPGRLELTADGRAWADALGDVFARLHAANRRLRGRGRERPVVAVSIIPSFATRWLVPRLGRFLARHRETDVRIAPSEKLVDFATESIDLGVRYGNGRYPGLVVDKLYDDAWIVVCTPELKRRARLRSVDGLRRVSLLRDDEPAIWQSWLAAHGGDSAWDRGPMLTDSAMVVEAALRGQGVALARLSLAADELAAGALVRAFPRIRPVPTGRSYYLVAPAHALQRREVAAFRSWLRREIRSLP